MKTKDIQFDHASIYPLAKKIWSTEHRKQTEVDHDYFTDLAPDEPGLPCLELRICPFGVFLTGNCVLPESLELWADGYNPNHEPNPKKLAKKILRKFGTLDDTHHFHLDHFPVEGMIFSLSHIVGKAEFFYCIDCVTPQINAQALKSKDSNSDTSGTQPGTKKPKDWADDDDEGEEWKNPKP